MRRELSSPAMSLVKTFITWVTFFEIFSSAQSILCSECYVEIIVLLMTSKSERFVNQNAGSIYFVPSHQEMKLQIRDYKFRCQIEKI